MAIACTFDELPGYLRKNYPFCHIVGIGGYIPGPRRDVKVGDGNAPSPAASEERVKWLIQELKKV